MKYKGLLFIVSLLFSSCAKAKGSSIEDLSSEEITYSESVSEETFKYDTLLYFEDIHFTFDNVVYLNNEAQIDTLFETLEEYALSFLQSHSDDLESYSITIDSDTINMIMQMKDMVKGYLRTSDLLVIPLKRYEYQSRYYLESFAYEDATLSITFNYQNISEEVESEQYIYDVCIIKFSKIYAEDPNYDITYQLNEE